jgi:hypothetical protein
MLTQYQDKATELELHQELLTLLPTMVNHQSVEVQVSEAPQDKEPQLLMPVPDQEHLPLQETLHHSPTLP